MAKCDVAIIGAGPYGLSIAAHLKGQGVDFRIFGHPMHTWLAHMPRGMKLKSEGFASCLYDPGSAFPLEVYCKEKGIPYAHMGLPVPLEVFASYGLEFQRRFVPGLETNLVTSLRRSPEGFRLGLDDGRSLTARRVVMAVGLTHYENMPANLAALGEGFATHSARHNTVDQFNGREVIVVGAGASALDLAALLYQAGAKVQVVARKPVIRFHDPPDNLKPSLIDRLRTPMTGIGPGWKLFWCANAPLIFRKMPQEFRFEKVRTVLGPAPCWFIKEQVVGKIPLNVDARVTEAKVLNGRVSLQLTDSRGTQSTLVADHIIAATGYKVDLRRLTFMDSDLQSAILSAEQTPVLSSNFESTVPGLYFVGTSAANTFGPLLRFAFGAGFTAQRLSRHLANSADRSSMSSVQKERTESREQDEVAVR